MLSSGFGGVPSSFVTNSSNHEVNILKRIVGFNLATDEQKTGASDLITLVNDLKAAGHAYTQFPPQPMTGTTTTMLGQMYSASASSSAANAEPWKAFGDWLTQAWSCDFMTDPQPYAYVPGETGLDVPVCYQGAASTTVSGVVYNGEWVQLLTPVPVYADKVVVSMLSAGPNGESQIFGSAVLAGSNDGVQWSLISEHLDLPPDVQYLHKRELTTGATVPYTHIRLIILTMMNSSSVAIRKVQILQSNRAIDMSADVAKVKNVIGFDDASEELQNGTGGTTLLARVAAVEASGGADVTGINTQLALLNNAVGVDGSPPTAASVPPAAMTSNILNYEGVSYDVTSSSQSASMYMAFNKNIADNWDSGMFYDDSLGTYTGNQTMILGGALVSGEYIQINTSVARELTEIVITPNQTNYELRSPRTFTLAAFVNSNWVTVLKRTDVTDWTAASKTFKFDTPTSSTNYRLFVSKVGNFPGGAPGQNRESVAEIEFFGELPYVVKKMIVLEQRIADLIFKLYGVTNLEDAP
jgi:hypothetical protein